MQNGMLFPTSRRFFSRASGGSVAVITRTKDRPILLARAFASVLAQTYQNWHLYLINDGGERAVVEALVEEYRTAFAGRVTVSHNDASVGMEAASNIGLAKTACNDYVVIHDDDDAWQPEFLEKTVKYLEDARSDRYVAVATNCTVVNERVNGSDVIEVSRLPWGYWKSQVDVLDQLSANRFPPICLLIRRDAMDIVGAYNEDLPVLGDWDYNIRLLALGDIGTIDEPLAYYYHRINNSKNDVYANSVTGGIDKHVLYQTLYRNSLLRTLFSENPGYIGLVHVLLKRIDQLGEYVAQADRVTQQIAGVRQKLDEIHYSVSRIDAAVAKDVSGIRQKLDEIHYSIGRANDAVVHDVVPTALEVRAALRPMRWVWRRLHPIRRIVAKARGRI